MRQMTAPAPETKPGEGLRKAPGPRYVYIPFGGGPRLCIGNSLAMMEAQLVLTTAA